MYAGFNDGVLKAIAGTLAGGVKVAKNRPKQGGEGHVCGKSVAFCHLSATRIRILVAAKFAGLPGGCLVANTAEGLL